MTYIVDGACIRCKYQDCVSVCPVDCFLEGPDFLVINPDECIDCGVCEPECPAGAIHPDTHMTPELEYWAKINLDLVSKYQPIIKKGAVPADADAWNPKLNKNIGDKKDLL
jgi:ferredoxin